MERAKVDSMNNKNNSQDNLILAINNLIKETNLSEYKVKLNEDKTVLKLNDDIYKKTK